MEWRRVNRRDRCPVCGHDSWCSVSADGALIVCMRTESGRASRNGGWVHRADGKVAVPPARSAPPAIDAQAMHRRHVADLSDAMADRLARNLRIPVIWLRMMGLGWSWEHSAYTWPMRNAFGGIIGLATRKPGGGKFAVPGSRNGLFLPNVPIDDDPLIVCEGPTDTAAMLALGYSAIGRQGCMGCVDKVIAFVESRAPVPRVVVMADYDPPGIDGAKELVAKLGAAGIKAVWMIPPNGIKDARAWYAAGVKRSEVQKAIDIASLAASSHVSRKSRDGLTRSPSGATNLRGSRETPGAATTVRAWNPTPAPKSGQRATPATRDNMHPSVTALVGESSRSSANPGDHRTGQ